MMLTAQAYGNLTKFISDNGRDPEAYDIKADWDSRLSYEANKQNIARLYGIPYNKANKSGFKSGTEKHYVNRPKQAKKEIDERYCQFLAENCESNCNDGACKVYRKEGCPGTVQPCKKDRFTKTTRRKAAAKTGGSMECMVVKYCVAEHERPPQHNSRTGQPIKVKAYCVEQHPRLCRRSGYS